MSIRLREERGRGRLVHHTGFVIDEHNRLAFIVSNRAERTPSDPALSTYRLKPFDVPESESIPANDASLRKPSLAATLRLFTGLTI